MRLTPLAEVTYAFGQEGYQDGNQSWKLLGDRAPENIQVDVKLGMHKPVPHSDDRIPWNVLELSAGSWGNPKCGFADDLDCFDERQHQHPAIIQVRAGPSSGKCNGLLCCIKHVPQTNGIIPEHTALLLLPAHSGESSD
jgi:hypothetical protein